jgi:hypothetical protein
MSSMTEKMQITRDQLRDVSPYSDTLYSSHYHCTMHCKLHSERETSLNHLLIKISHPHPISSPSLKLRHWEIQRLLLATQKRYPIIKLSK